MRDTPLRIVQAERLIDNQMLGEKRFDEMMAAVLDVACRVKIGELKLSPEHKERLRLARSELFDIQ